MSLGAFAPTSLVRGKHESGLRTEIAALIGILALTIVLRSVNLLSLPIFNDEAVYLRWAADIVDQRTWMSLFIPVFEDGKQPMFIWLSVAAMSFFSDPLLAGRVVSVAAGVVSVMGIWLSGRWIGGQVLGLIVAFLYAVTPYTLVFDRMALADSQVSSAAIWTFGLGVFAATRVRSREGAVLTGLALGGIMAFGVWVKPTALFALPIPILSALLLSRNLKPPRLVVLSLAVAYLLFGAVASLLIVMPYAQNQLVLLATHVYSADELSSSLPVYTWESSAGLYWQWFQSYLPAPLYWLSIAGLAWALVYRTRYALLLLLCWIGIVVPSVALAHYFASRYVLNSVFPLIIFAAFPLHAVSTWLSSRLRGHSGAWISLVGPTCLALVLVVIVSVPSLLFDMQVVTDPSMAPWPASDRKEYVEGWSAGYGFNEALALALSKAHEYRGQEVFIMSDQIQGFPHDGLALYIRHMPNIQHYVEAEIAWGGRGVINNWRAHKAKMLIIRDDGRHKPEMFESRIPEAKLLGIFWKPGGKSSFRVYELDLHAAGSTGG